MKNESIYLSHIITRCKKIMDITSSQSFEEFEENTDSQDIMIRSFEIIGEAATHFPDDYINKHPEIAWREIRAFRNVLVHQYFRLDLREIWDVAVNDIPALYSRILPLMK